MLQQTQVKTVVPYFTRFVERFPTLEHLADAEEDELLGHWRGLGYYGRARSLQRAARLVRDRFAGQMPQEPELLQQLPGVGEYTAGAIASLAYGRPAAAVDGNVERVFTRLFDIAAPTQRLATKRSLRALGLSWSQCADPRLANEALIEFGALACRPRQPLCASCPARSDCMAYGRGSVEQRPVKQTRAKSNLVLGVAMLCRHTPVPNSTGSTGAGSSSTGVLLEQCAGRRFGGLWVPPMATKEGSGLEELAAQWKREPQASRSSDQLQQLTERLQLPANVSPEYRGWVGHTLSHRRYVLAVYACALPAGSLAAPGDAKTASRQAWFDDKDLGTLAMPRLTTKILGLGQTPI